MRKYMTKEVTSTTIKIAKVGIDENGLPIVNQLDPVIMLGSISKERAQKTITKDLGLGITVFGVEEETATYKMKVTDFIKVAELSTDNEEEEDEEEEEE